MRERLILTSAARTLAETRAPDLLRSRITTLLADPGVAERVRRRLHRAQDAASRNGDMAGTPPCLRASADIARAPTLVRNGHCRQVCRSIDCLCGQYPRALGDAEIAEGRRRQPLAV
jgi:hypothetical protein